MKRRSRRMSRALRLTSLAPRLLALIFASGSLAGCCNQVDGTRCFDWDQSSTCPDPESVVTRLGADKVNSQGTFWPSHEYVINGAHTTVPAACCYEITYTICNKDLR